MSELYPEEQQPEECVFRGMWGSVNCCGPGNSGNLIQSDPIQSSDGMVLLVSRCGFWRVRNSPSAWRRRLSRDVFIGIVRGFSVLRVLVCKHCEKGGWPERAAGAGKHTDRLADRHLVA